MRKGFKEENLTQTSEKDKGTMRAKSEEKKEREKVRGTLKEKRNAWHFRVARDWRKKNDTISKEHY